MNPANTIHCAACYTAAQALADRPELSERVRAAGMAIAEMDKELGALRELIEKVDPIPMPKYHWVQASKAECDAFVRDYPHPLIYDVMMFYDPPLGSWNDFRNGKVWPQSMVAQVKLQDGDDRLPPEEAKNVYYLKKLV